MIRKEITSVEPGKCIYRQYEDEPLKNGFARVSVEHAAAKHGTEFTSFLKLDPFIGSYYDEKFGCFIDRDYIDGGFGFAPGNMWVGRVEEVASDVDKSLIGSRVAGYGPFRETHVRRAADLMPLADSMTWKQAVCFDPIQFALGGVRDGHIRIGDRVAVFGLGAIGLLAAQLAKLSGARCVICADPIARRRAAALENGADYALDPSECDAGLEIRKLTDMKGCDVVLECSGSYTALQGAIRSVAYCGNVTIVGWYKECHGVLDIGREAHFNQPNIIMSRACNAINRDHPRWDFDRICKTGWDMLSDGLLKCENIVDPVVPFAAAAGAYEAIAQDPKASVKLGVDFTEK